MLNVELPIYERKILESMACLIELSDDIIYFLEEDNSKYMRESLQSVAQRLKTLLEEIGAERGKAANRIKFERVHIKHRKGAFGLEAPF